MDMFLAKKGTTLGWQSVIRIFIAAGFLFIGPLLGTTHVDALSMDHDTQNIQNCTGVCVSNQRTNIQSEVPIAQTEKKLPAPPIESPDFVQFRDLVFSTPLPPIELIYSSSFKPPDLNLLHSVFRF